MNWEAVGAVGEFIGAIAVFISLIYLALQIRKNTETERTSTYQSVVSDFAGLTQTMASTEGLSILFVNGMEDFESLNASDKASCAQLLFSYFHYFENMYYQYKKGYLEEDVWLGWKRLMLTYFHSCGVQSWWKLRRDVFSQTFAEFLESAEIDKPVASYLEVTKLGETKSAVIE